MKKRNIGLDIIRIAAMVMVWICHSGFFSIGLSYPFLSFAGVLCVEIFFVLSGLLVGKSLILSVTDDVPGKALGRFYINRCFRTLPLYYAALLLTAVSAGSSIPVSCLFFVHNFSETDIAFLPPAWSLSIEAWFYFLIPLLFFAFYRIFSKKCEKEKAVFFTIGILWLIPFVLRVITVFFTETAWDYGIRKQIFQRLDSIMIGVLFAAIKIYHKDMYHKIARSRGSLLASLGGILAIYAYYCAFLVVDANFDQSTFWKIFLFTFLPLLCVILVLYMENASVFEKLRGTWAGKMICGISSLGYGAYLIHWFVFEKVSVYFVGAGFAENWIGFLGAIILTLVLGAVLYLLVEIPLTKVRDRIISKL